MVILYFHVKIAGGGSLMRVSRELKCQILVITFLIKSLLWEGWGGRVAIVMSFETDFKGGRLAKQIKTNFVCGWCHYEMERSVSMLTAHCQRLVPQELLVLSRVRRSYQVDCFISSPCILGVSLLTRRSHTGKMRAEYSQNKISWPFLCNATNQMS